MESEIVGVTICGKWKFRETNVTLNIVIGVADTCTPAPSVYEVCIDEWEWDFVSKKNGIWNILQQIVALGISWGGASHRVAGSVVQR